MRKLFKLGMLTLVLSLVSLTVVNAQSDFRKSDKFVEGTVSYSKSTDVKSTWSVAPTVGYFLTNKIAVGVSSQFGKTDTTKITNVSVFGRYYFLNLGKSAKIYSELAVGGNRLNTLGERTTSLNSNLGLGVNYFVNQRIALTAGLTNLINYQYKESVSDFSIGFTGVDNPIASAKFGLLYKL